MPSEVKLPEQQFDALLKEMGEVGMRLSEMNACEGTAGNLSVCLSAEVDPAPFFGDAEPYDLPEAFPELAGKSVLATGSQCRLRDLLREPGANLGLIKLGADGRRGQLFTDKSRHFVRLTTELYSHLVLHQRGFRDPLTTFQAIVHAQPRMLTYLTHIPRYRGARELSTAILRWQPELTVIFPIGLAYVPYAVPNSDELAAATRAVDLAYDLIVWEKHGVLAVSDKSVMKAFDLVEYVETGAHYEYLNLLSGDAGEGLLPEEIGAIRRHFKLPNGPHDVAR